MGNFREITIFRWSLGGDPEYNENSEGCNTLSYIGSYTDLYIFIVLMLFVLTMDIVDLSLTVAKTEHLLN